MKRGEIIKQHAEIILPHLLERELTGQEIGKIVGANVGNNEINRILNYLQTKGYLTYEDEINGACNVYGILKRCEK